MTSGRRLTARVLLGLIVLTVAVIFLHSAMSPEVSSSESGAVGEIVDKVVPDSFSLKQFIIDNIRKIAHFLEFGLLGAEVYALILALSVFGTKSLSLSLGFGAAVAFFDESVQLLSNRGPSITDMWIDIFGYLSFSLIAALVHLIVYCIKKRKNKEKI